jgi:hypothetical protein
MVNMREAWNKKDLQWEENENNCWICTSHSKDDFGHIPFRRNGYYYAHRYIYAKYYGDITSEQIVRHKCDNPSCINVEHLEIGTHQDNVRDRVERNRSAKGEGNGRSKLSEKDVELIKLNTTHTRTELANMYEVDDNVIYQIWKGKTWKHILPDIDPKSIKRKIGHPIRKLSDEQVKEIRLDKNSSHRILASKFSIDEKAVRDIRNYKTYKHVV